MMNIDNDPLIKILSVLEGSWEVQDFQLAGMGWAAVIIKGSHLFTLHSERGWIDIYNGDYSDQIKMGCTNSLEEVAKIINGKTA